MRIGLYLPASPGVDSNGSNAKGSTKVSASDKTDASTGDEAAMSTATSRLTDLQASSATGGDLRTEKVEALRRAIGDGSYSVDQEKVAGSLLDELLG